MIMNFKKVIICIVIIIPLIFQYKLIKDKHLRELFSKGIVDSHSKIVNFGIRSIQLTCK